MDTTLGKFNTIKKYSYITDEHRCFDKLKSDYNLNIYKCFTHLIRSVGPHSALGLLLRDILYYDTKEEYEKDYLKNVKLFQKLYEIDKVKDDARYMKVAKVLGVDQFGNQVDI